MGTIYSSPCIVPHLQDHNYAKSYSRQHLEGHNYSKKTPESTNFTVDQQYADDISWASISLSTLETIESIVPAELRARNLYEVQKVFSDINFLSKGAE